MSDDIRPDLFFNNEESNNSDTISFDQILDARLSRRGLLRGVLGASGAGLLGTTGLAAAATVARGKPSNQPAPVTALGFTAVAKGIADRIAIAPGYRYQIIYALGDPLFANTPAFKNDGTDAAWAQRAGDHHDGMEWFGLNAGGRPSDRSIDRGLLAMNHEATTDEKLTSFFIHADGGKATLPRNAAEVDKELAIHGLSVVEVEAKGGNWSTKQASRFNRRVTSMTDMELHGPLRGSDHAITRFSPNGTRSRGTVNNCGTGKTPWGTFVSGEENFNGYFFRDAGDDERRGGKGNKQVIALERYGRKAGAASRHGWESAGTQDQYMRWNNGALGATARDDYRNEMNTFGYVVEMDA